MSPEPTTGVPFIVRMFVPETSVACAPISAKVQVTLPLPSTDLPVLPMVTVRAVPHDVVVMLADPLKLVPFIVRAVWMVVAVAALPVHEAELPVTFIAHEPLAPVPVRVGE